MEGLQSIAAARQATYDLFDYAGLPYAADSVLFTRTRRSLPSSFALDEAASASIAASAFAAATILALRSGKEAPRVKVAMEDAAAEFRLEQLSQLDGETPAVWDALAGVYKTREGFIRPHTNWKHHRDGLLRLLGLPEGSVREEVAAAVGHVDDAHDFAEVALLAHGLPVTSLRTFAEWDQHPQSLRVSRSPLQISRTQESEPAPLPPLSVDKESPPLHDVRVLDLSRVIAGPVGGRTLAQYGADVLWITSPHLPSLPGLDYVTSIGKRPVQLDLRSPGDRATFEDLVRKADVLLQAYRPGSLAGLGYGPSQLRELNPKLVYAYLCAWSEGPFAQARGFDSLVQTAAGFNHAEGVEYASFKGEKSWAPKSLPCQALDHAAGYLLAFGIQAALFKRATIGGVYDVSVTLQATSHWVRSFGRLPASSFSAQLETLEGLEARGQAETLQRTDGKTVRTVKHAAVISGVEFGPSVAPAGLTGSQLIWL